MPTILSASEREISGRHHLKPLSGHYKYLVMPFDSTNASAVFQALINDVLSDMLNRYVFVYLNKVLTISCALEEHVNHVHSFTTAPAPEPSVCESREV